MPVTQIVEFPGSTGLAAGAVVKLYAPGSDTASATASAVAESTNRKGVYQATFTDVPAGNYLLSAIDANGNPICAEPLNGLTLTAATFQTASIANIDKTGYRLAVEIRNGTAQAGASGSITLDSGASATDNLYKGCWIVLTSGTGAGQARLCTGYTGSTKVATVAPNWTTAPDVTSVFTILPAGDVLNVEGNVTGSVASVTNAVTLPATAPTGWITAAGIAASALNGKGDWATAGAQMDLVNAPNATAVTAIQNGLSKPGIAQTIDQTTALPTTPVADSIGEALKRADTNLDAAVSSRSTYAGGAVASVTAAVTVGTNNDKAGYALSASGLDSISVTDPGGVANQTTFPKILVALYRRFFKKSTLTSTQLKTYADDGTTVNTTQAVSDDGVTQTQGTAT